MDTPDTARHEALRLFEEHGPAVYRFALMLLRRHQDAEDVVQETFLKLLQHLGGGGDARNLRGWLFTVAAHAARDRQRRALRWLPWPSGYDVAGPPGAREEGEDDRLIAARAALQRLPPRDRLLLGLRANGLSYREIAAGAGIRAASVGRLLARAMARWASASAQQLPLGTPREGHETP